MIVCSLLLQGPTRALRKLLGTRQADRCVCVHVFQEEQLA